MLSWLVLPLATTSPCGRALDPQPADIITTVFHKENGNILVRKKTVPIFSSMHYNFSVKREKTKTEVTKDKKAQFG
jgi:hypothetical protein